MKLVQAVLLMLALLSTSVVFADDGDGDCKNSLYGCPIDPGQCVADPSSCGMDLTLGK